MEKIQVVSLDIFQTLVNVNKRIPHIWKAILKEDYTEEMALRGAKAVANCYTKAIRPVLLGERHFMTMRDVYLDCAVGIIEEMGIDVSPELVVDQIVLNHREAPYYEDVWETLEYLKQHYRVIISSDSSNSMADPIVDKVQPEYAFISDDLHCYKGEKTGRFFSIVASKLNLPPEAILHIGDSSSDIIGAKEAGVKAVWLNRTGSKWRFDTKPDYEISSLKELIR